MLAPETLLQDRYLILRVIGQGGMGSVYMATDQRLKSTVALKETLFADERLRRAFEHEAELLASLHHPALPNVSDHFIEGEGQFLVMQFIPGDDLSEMLKRNGGPFNPDDVAGWGDQLLDALDYLHTQNPPIIHRDIKPQNIKLTSRGQVILLDFGLAKGTPLQISRVTASGSIFGYTPNYAPLEQVHGTGTDARSDLYALAATLYHLTTGTTPPDALSRASAVVSDEPDPLKPANEVNSAVSTEVAVVLRKAMSQNKVLRYSSANEMRKALKDARYGLPATQTIDTEAKTVLMSDRAATSSHKSGELAGAAPTAVLPGGTRPVTASEQPAADTNPDDPAVSAGETEVATRVRKTSAAPRSGFKPWYLAVAALVLVLGGLGISSIVKHSISTAPTVAPAATPSPDVKTQETPQSQVTESPQQDQARQPQTPPQTEEKTLPGVAEKGSTAKTQTRKEKSADSSDSTTTQNQNNSSPWMDAETKRELENARRDAEQARREGAAAREAERRNRRNGNFPVPPPPGSDPSNQGNRPYGRHGGQDQGPRITTETNPDGSKTTTIRGREGRVTKYTINRDGTLRGKPEVQTNP